MVRRLIWPFALAALLGAAGVLWWMSPFTLRDDTLAPDWSARVRVIAGDGTSGTRDGSAARAQFADPFGVAVAQDGTIYVADGAEGNRLRVITPAGNVHTLAGGARGFADGSGSAAQFNTPSAIALDATGALYVADTGNNAIRRVTPDGQVTTVAGRPEAGFRDGPAADARFNGPIGIAVDASGRVLVADTYNDRIRVIGPDGVVSTIAGSARGNVDGSGANARFDTPSGIAVDAHGTIYVADTGNNAVRRLTPSGEVTLVSIATASAASTVPGGVPLNEPIGVTVDVRGALYVTASGGRVIEYLPPREGAPAGVARVVAGSSPGFVDGEGADAQFRRLAGIAAAGPGQLIVADAGNHLVRSVVATSVTALAPPPSPLIAPAFDREAFAWQPMLWPLDPLEGPFEIAGTLGEARGSGAERFHAGIDVRAEQGSRVVAIREGVVQAPVATGAFGTLSEWMRIGPVAYVHLRVGRSREGALFDSTRFVATRDERGTIVGMRVKRGARFLTGERIGSVNQFNHVHVNVGWPGEEYNPLLFRLVQFRDTIAPTIAAGGIRLYTADGERLTRRVKGRLVVSGPVQIVVDAWDRADGNRPNRRLGLYSLGYQILERDGTPAPGFATPRETILFDQLRGSDAAALVFAEGSGIPFYSGGRTRFLYIVTNTFRGGRAERGLWDPATLPAGDYVLRIHAADVHGNQAQRNRDLPITIERPTPAVAADSAQ